MGNTCPLAIGFTFYGPFFNVNSGLHVGLDHPKTWAKILSYNSPPSTLCPSYGHEEGLTRRFMWVFIVIGPLDLRWIGGLTQFGLFSNWMVQLQVCH